VAIAPGALVAIDTDQRRVAGYLSIEAKPAGVDVGGWLAPQYRGQGLGRELFAAALVFGHQHLGIEVLRAGTQDSNTASLKSLEAAGFQPAQGAPTYQLPNGRVIPSRWYEHIAPVSHCNGYPLP
jgi:RimJ/RimL family protein N-acetyltransferase